jgi:hypothetical protein
MGRHSDTSGRPEKHCLLKSWDMEYTLHGSVLRGNSITDSSLEHSDNNVPKTSKS